MNTFESRNTRLHQRYQNFQKVLNLLENALSITTPSVTERAGIIQFYEMTFELAWKCLKDFLESRGLDPKYPRETIKTAIGNGVIGNESSWMKALADRNVTSHTYDESAAIAIENSIRKDYYPLLKELDAFLKSETGNRNG